MAEPKIEKLSVKAVNDQVCVVNEDGEVLFNLSFENIVISADFEFSKFSAEGFLVKPNRGRQVTMRTGQAIKT